MNNSIDFYLPKDRNKTSTANHKDQFTEAIRRILHHNQSGENFLTNGNG